MWHVPPLLEYVILWAVLKISPGHGGLFFMTQLQGDQWPDYTYIVPQIYTKAGVRLIGLGNYVPSGTITNEFFAYISTRLGDPRSADDLERVTGLSTRHVRASTLALCRHMAGPHAPRLLEGARAPTKRTLGDMAGYPPPAGPPNRGPAAPAKNTHYR